LCTFYGIYQTDHVVEWSMIAFKQGVINFPALHCRVSSVGGGWFRHPYKVQGDRLGSDPNVVEASRQGVVLPSSCPLLAFPCLSSGRLNPHFLAR
jgi:hypothetical protein